LEIRRWHLAVSLILPDTVYITSSVTRSIDALRNARPLPPKRYQPLHDTLAGIHEIRLSHDDNTYRVYVTLKCPWIIMVLDAGMKKSTEGKNIPEWQKERLEARYKKAREKDWRNDPLENTPPVRGSGNFLKDRGYSDPTETRIKFDLVNLIRAIVESKKLRQIDVVGLVGRYVSGAGISQPDISRILRGNVNGYSESRLIVILAALGNNVSIVVEPTKGHGHISVRERAVA
jgi:predicted XRE-type DNA-binding protein/phage-related protein